MPAELLTRIAVSQPIAYTATGTTTITGTVDLQGYDGVLFLGSFNTIDSTGTVAGGNVNYFKVGQGDASNGSDAVDLTGSATIPLVNGDLVAIDVYRPCKGTVGPRYITISAFRGGTTTILPPVIAIRYGGHKQPIDNTVASASIAKVLISPAEGTA